MNKETIDQFRAALPRLKPSDREFGESLLKQYFKRGLSDKQVPWIAKLIERANPATAPQPITVGSMQGVITLLERAAEHLKFPAVLVLADGKSMRLSLAGSQAKVPGSVNVNSVERLDDTGRRDWFGRVTTDGKFDPAKSQPRETTTAIAAALVALATDPEAAAREYGRLTGICCFCARPLKDERSTAVGYGRICADHYGLPWGAEQ